MDRCIKCRKKILMIYACTCRGTFCLRCRMPEDHDCKFDHQAAYKELLKLKNPKVESKKLESI